MEHYYNVSVNVEHQDGDKVKFIKEQYLVQALSVTDAEAKVNEFFKSSVLDFEVLGATRTKIIDVIK